MPDLTFLDTAEKILIVAGIVALIAAATAPKLPWVQIGWTINRQRALAVAGVLFLILSYPPLRNFKFGSTEDTDALRQKFNGFVIQEIKGTALPMVMNARQQAWGASTNASNARGCTNAAVESMKTLDEVERKLNDFVLAAFKL